MRKIYFLLFLLVQTGMAFTQVNTGYFEMRLTSPGDQPGLFRVQMRAISTVLPTTDDFVGDLTFKIWWNDVLNPTIADIDINTATSFAGVMTESNPEPGLSGGTSGTSGKVVPMFPNNFPFNFPTNWVLNEWVNIGDITICSNNNCSPAGSPAGITAANFLIQGFTGSSPNINVFQPSSGQDPTDYTPAAGPLPLNLIAFDAKKSGERNSHLSWTTANEENTSHFLVQRSLDLKTWSDVGTVAAAGYSIDIRNYELNDFDVYNGLDSRLQVHYRLVMVDLDGRSKLSPIKSVTFGNTSSTNREFLVYPNPASNGVYVEWDVDEFSQPTALEFYDINGKLILTQVVGEKATQEYVDFTKSTMLPGLYLLRVMKGAEPIDYKQIVVGQR